MGEEQKKAEEPKKEEEKKEEAVKSEPEKVVDEKKEEKKGDDDAKESKEAPPPPPPQEIVLKIYMHCEGCAKKVRKCLRGFEGVENVITDCKTHKVIVKGEKADPLKVLERLQRKSHRQVELLSPIPKPPPPEEPKKPEEKEVKPEEKKEEPQVVTVVLSFHMHCEACAQEIRKRIQRMKGVESAGADLKSSQVTVKGIFDPPKLVESIRKRTGKQAAIVKVEPEKKEEEKPKENAEEKPKEEGGEKEAVKGKPEGDKNKKEGGDGGGGGGEANKTEAPQAQPQAEAPPPQMEVKKNELYYYHPQNFQYYPPMHVHQDYPPQIFSDENPNACSIM